MLIEVDLGHNKPATLPLIHICYDLYFQQLTQERYMNLKSVYLEEWITVFYHLQNMDIDVHNIQDI